MLHIETKTDYVSSSINKYPKCASWKKVLACGMHHSIVLVKHNSMFSKIFRIMKLHKSYVTCVYWITDFVLLSADSEGMVVLSCFDENFEIKTTQTAVTGIKTPIIDLSGTMVGNLFIFSCCSQDKCVIFSVNNNKNEDSVQLIKYINYDPNFVLSTNLCCYEDHIMIISGLSDGNLICYLHNMKTSDTSKGIMLPGHDNWVVALDSLKANNNIYIVSSSQDNFCRVWRVCINDDQTPKGKFEVEKFFLACDLNVHIFLESVLAAHENWVKKVEILRYGETLRIVSFSMDKSIIIWEKSDYNDTEWVEVTRLGQIGGNGLGFIGGCINDLGNTIIGYGYQGDPISYGFKANTDTQENWTVIRTWGGHFDDVEDLSWDPTGKYLVTVSKDQTTRIHGNCIPDSHVGWIEIGRPQIHGYDMKCVVCTSSIQFVTGADEKIGRVFCMNKQFYKKAKEYGCMIELSDDDESKLRTELVSSDALGLSNRFAGEVDDSSTNFPELETLDKTNLFWPEVMKLYGHELEIFRVSCDKQARFLVTSGKANNPNHADLIVWRLSDFKAIQRLSFHKTTVVRTQFNNQGNRFVSVSKDRHWALWHLDPSEQQFSLDKSSVEWAAKLNRNKPPHAKVIWDVDWSNDDKIFFTVSRDKSIIAWDAMLGEKIGDPLVFNASVNAIAVFPQYKSVYDYIAVGLETGELSILHFDRTAVKDQWTIINNTDIHDNWITRLRFQPINTNNTFVLASCGLDHFVKIHRIIMTNQEG